MIRKRFVVSVLAVGALLAAVQPHTRHRIAATAQNFQHRFEDLKLAGNSINPVERVVFSLALAGAAPVKEAK